MNNIFTVPAFRKFDLSYAKCSKCSWLLLFLCNITNKVYIYMISAANQCSLTPCFASIQQNNNGFVWNMALFCEYKIDKT